jgi:plastocyanin
MKTIIKGFVCATAIAGMSTSAMAASYKVVDVANSGKIVGKVAAGAAAVKTKSYTISKDPQICGEGTRDVNLVRIKDGVLLDTVVYLKKVKEGKAFEDGMQSLTINQKGCEFSPALGFIANGGKLTATNSDATLHNIHTYEQIGRARRTIFNVSQPEKGDTVTKKVKARKGVGMKVECDAHDFMHSFVFIAPNPYFAAVKEDGTYEISGVPAGKYKINVWHGTLGVKKGGKVEVKADGSATVDFSY